MGTKNAYLTKLQTQKAIEIRQQRLFTIQWCADAAAMAVNDVFKRKGEIVVEFLETMRRYSEEIAHMTLADAKDDSTIEYTKEKIDGRLKDILGEAFQPWEERYK